MNDHNLDDLIIGAPAPVGKKSKSLLAIIALVVIILLVGILLSKMILGTSENDVSLADKNQTAFVSPELIPVDETNTGTKKGDLSPIKKEKLPKPKPKKSVQKTIPKKPVTKVVKKQQVVQKTKPVKVVVKKQPTVKKPVKVSVEKTKIKKKPKPSALFNKGKSAYYIQIGAFNREPNPKFLKKIEQAGLQYVVNKNEKTRRVRVGPYGSYGEAKAALGDVNSSIGIMGFVVKQK